MNSTADVIQFTTFPTPTLFLVQGPIEDTTLHHGVVMAPSSPLVSSNFSALKRTGQVLCILSLDF